MNSRKGIAYSFAAIGFVVSAGAAAQTIDNVEWVGAGAQAVARIHFAANVHFLRQVPRASESTDVVQLSFQIISGDEAVQNQAVPETRRLPAQAGWPNIDLSYVPLASVPNKLLTLRFDGRVSVAVRQGQDLRSIDLVFTPLERQQVLPMPAMAASEQDRHFVVLLQEQNSAPAHLPAQLADYAVFSRKQSAADTGASDLLLGYFSTQADAALVREQALTDYPGARVLSWPLEPEVAVVPKSASEVDASGAELLGKGQRAMADKRYQDAVDIFNQALMLPPNASAQLTQELIGQAWEGLNKPDKAALEYQLYLKLYPDGLDAARVATRLQTIQGNTQAAQATPGKAADGKPAKSRYDATGSLSHYYYGGNTKTETLLNIASGIDQNTLNLTNQSVVVTSWDATGRYAGDGSETKLVMRGSHSDNLASNSTATTSTQGLISAAYMDYRDLQTRLSLRGGRQSAIGGAMFGLFDGVSMSMPLLGDYKFDAMLGVPANTLITAPQQVMAGVMVEADNLLPHWGGNVSLVQQTTEGVTDRRAVGLDARYFGETLSMFSQIDYDININALNAVTLQGSAPGPYDTTITMMVDDRKAPSLQLSDALISSGYSSLGQLLQVKSLSEVQSMALSTAAEAKQAMVSVSRALSPKWQGSVDFRYSDVSALPAIGNFQATAATGAQYNVSVQLTGSNLYSERDINGFNLSYLTSDSLQGTQIGYNNMTGIWGSKGSLEPSIRYYTQIDNTGTTVSRLSPGLRLSYKYSPRISMMAETILESSKTDGPTNHETSTAVYFYAGYRYDFQ